MQDVLSILRRLDEVYHTGNFTEYELLWQEAIGKIEQLFPGITLAYAEIYTQGQERTPSGSMRHSLVPAERNY